MKKFLALLLSLSMAFTLAACGGDTSTDTTGEETTGEETTGEETSGDLINIGFAQVGHESDWRAASTNSAYDVFSEENGYNLSFSDADNDQAVQIQAVRTFIQQGMDYIIIDPIIRHRLGCRPDRVRGCRHPRVHHRPYRGRL